MFPSFAAVLLLLLELPSYSDALAASTTSDLGIFQLVTPTAQASLVPASALAQFSEDAINFYTSYLHGDTFQLVAALDAAIASAATRPGNNEASLLAQNAVILTLYYDADTSLLENPTAYLSRLSSSASPWPYSTALMSQASGLLLGFESLVTQDILNITVTQAVVTPGISVKVGPAANVVSTTAATGSRATNAVGTTAGAPSTSSSKAFGVPVATANPQLMYSCVIAAAGMFGMVLL